MRKFLSIASALILAAVGAVVGFAQVASTPYATSLYYASAFGQWAIQNQNANSYTFQGGSSVCYANAQNLKFAVFKVNDPILINDIGNPANSEVSTASAASTLTGSCSVTLSPANNHFTFQVQSGTGGLQEALNTLANSQVNLPAVVVLDRNWYTYANNIPGTTPQAIILAATGSSGIMLEDVTTDPETGYIWDGSKYTAAAAPAGLPWLKYTSVTGISAPTALSTGATTNGIITTAATGGTVAAATYRLAATYVDASGGETLISTDSASTATIATSGTTSTVVVTSPAAATGAVGWRLYMSAASGAAGSEILYTPTCTKAGSLGQKVLVNNTVCAIGATATIAAVVTGTATVPALASAFPRTSGSSGGMPPFAAAGTIASAATGTLAVVNIPASWMNTIGKQFMLCGNGYATTNGTGGTVTVATTLASVPGVTSITPFTAVSGTIAASVIQLPFDFCVTYTTAVVGTSGKLEAHGWVDYGVAGTAVGTVSMDFIFTASSAIDLTAQDQLAVTITPTTAGLSAAQVRQLSIVPIN